MSNKASREALVILAARALHERRPEEEVIAEIVSYGCDDHEASKLIAIAGERVARHRAEQRKFGSAPAVWTICIGAALLAAALYASWERNVNLASLGWWYQ